jgi:hypothetical protein
MTNDKTVTMSRELLDRVIARLDDGGWYGLTDELHAVLAQEAGKVEPVAEVDRACQGYLKWTSFGSLDMPRLPNGAPLYASPPAPITVPDGWKLVPIEPTAEMLVPIAQHEWPADWEAGKHLQRLRGAAVVLTHCETECAVGQYARMLAAAPEYANKLKEMNQ